MITSILFLHHSVVVRNALITSPLLTFSTSPFADLNEHDCTTYIINIMSASCVSTLPECHFKLRLNGSPVCLNAFQKVPTLFIAALHLLSHLTLLLYKVHGFSRKKWRSAKQIFISGGRVPIHNTTGQQRPSNATSNTHLWLTTFFDVIGDHLPDATIHLPISLTW
jgi:hypothetical protein